MKIKTSELKDAALDWAVAESSDANWRVRNGAVIVLTRVPCPDKRVGCLVAHFSGKVFAPSTDWAQGGPIIERERIQFRSEQNIQFRAFIGLYGAEAVGETHLIAAMRCLVASKLGDEVDVPEELL